MDKSHMAGGKVASLAAAKFFGHLNQKSVKKAFAADDAMKSIAYTRAEQQLLNEMVSNAVLAVTLTMVELNARQAAEIETLTTMVAELEARLNRERA